MSFLIVIDYRRSKWKCITIYCATEVNPQQTWPSFSFCHAEKWFSKIFLLGEKSPKIPKIRDNPHGHQEWWPSTPSPPNTNQNALWQAVQLPLQRKNHHSPNPHSGRKPLHCSSPPSGLTCHLSPPQWTEYSQIWLSMFWASVQNPHKQKKKHDQKIFFYARESLKQ